MPETALIPELVTRDPGLHQNVHHPEYAFGIISPVGSRRNPISSRGPLSVFYHKWQQGNNHRGHGKNHHIRGQHEEHHTGLHHDHHDHDHHHDHDNESSMTHHHEYHPSIDGDTSINHDHDHDHHHHHHHHHDHDDTHHEDHHQKSGWLHNLLHFPERMRQHAADKNRFNVHTTVPEVREQLKQLYVY